MWISTVLRTATEMELPIMDETTQPFIPAHELAKIWGVNGAMGESPYESPIFRLIVGQNEISHQSVGENCWPTLTNKMLKSEVFP